ncbi:hydrolase [Oryctes borbonicus]|uniref:Hydrolase n=1 Tax=Oryctes borbonicus TaxID=1629725 RepID=A0A0T6ATQ4_9SCAR|nr:hydrolase [Oryctes borbonicus]
MLASNCNCSHHQYRTVSHCIFDLDGTLLDTEPIYTEIYIDMLKEHGENLTSDLRQKIAGTTNEETWKITTRETTIKLPWKLLAEEYRKRSHARLGNCQLLPGVERLLLHLWKHQIPMAIASSTTSALFECKTKVHMDLFKVFHHVVCGGTDQAVSRGKPQPDVYLVCADRFEEKPRPGNCLAFEDCSNGVQAAIGAGMQCVAIYAKDIPKKNYNCSTMVINSLEEFQPQQFGLPSFDT